MTPKYKIFGRNKGRKKNFIMNKFFFKNSLINLEKDLNKKNINILDIGSGSGENSIFLALKYPSTKIIACEVFQDGNINLCNQLYKKKIDNVKIYQNNVLKLFDEIKVEKYFDSIWILFPDPWPKKRHHKRRLINSSFFRKIYPLMKSKGKIYLSTDSKSYLASIMQSIYEVRSIFDWKNDIPTKWQYNLDFLPDTKFFKKANNLQRSAFFIDLEKI